MTLPDIGTLVKVRNAIQGTYEGRVTAHSLVSGIFWFQVLKVDGEDKPAGSYPRDIPQSVKDIVE